MCWTPAQQAEYLPCIYVPSIIHITITAHSARYFAAHMLSIVVHAACLCLILCVVLSDLPCLASPVQHIHSFIHVNRRTQVSAEHGHHLLLLPPSSNFKSAAPLAPSGSTPPTPGTPKAALAGESAASGAVVALGVGQHALAHCVVQHLGGGGISQTARLQLLAAQVGRIVSLTASLQQPFHALSIACQVTILLANPCIGHVVI
jgi:hypothetical protein